MASFLIVFMGKAFDGIFLSLCGRQVAKPRNQLVAIASTTKDCMSSISSYA